MGAAWALICGGIGLGATTWGNTVKVRYPALSLRILVSRGRGRRQRAHPTIPERDITLTTIEFKDWVRSLILRSAWRRIWMRYEFEDSHMLTSTNKRRSYHTVSVSINVGSVAVVKLEDTRYARWVVGRL